MATEKRLIDANTLLKAIEPDKVTCRFGVPNTLDTMVDFLRLIINEQPAVDAVEVVRCKDCTYIGKTCGDYWCDREIDAFPTDEENFCSYGERRPDDH